MKKKQNTRRSLTDSVQRIYNAGMMVTAGFIIGFDSETGSIARPMADFIEDAAIPVAMVGLLSALPNTQMTRRLISEHRLHDGHDFHPDGRGDQCMQGLNFETVRAATGDPRGLLPGAQAHLRACGLLWSRRAADRQA